MKLIDAKGNRVNLKEKEKVIPTHRVGREIKQTLSDDAVDLAVDKEIEMKDNMCEIDDFKCYHSDKNPCVYLSDGNGTLLLHCKYDNLGWCMSAVARTNAMVMELKKMGFKYVRLEG